VKKHYPEMVKVHESKKEQCRMLLDMLPWKLESIRDYDDRFTFTARIWENSWTRHHIKLIYQDELEIDEPDPYLPAIFGEEFQAIRQYPASRIEIELSIGFKRYRKWRFRILTLKKTNANPITFRSVLPIIGDQFYWLICAEEEEDFLERWEEYTFSGFFSSLGPLVGPKIDNEDFCDVLSQIFEKKIFSA
jgi:hypothetical protein